MRLVLCERYLNLSLKKIDEFSNAIFVTMSSSSVTISSSSWNTKLACLFRDVYVRHVPRIDWGMAESPLRPKNKLSLLRVVLVTGMDRMSIMRVVVYWPMF